MTGPDVDWVLQRFVECGGRSSIALRISPASRQQSPAPDLPQLPAENRSSWEANIASAAGFEGLDIADGQIRGVQNIERLYPGAVPSSWQSDTAPAIPTTCCSTPGVPLSAKAFQLGLRIEHPQEEVNLQKYGRPEYVNLLGAADYSLVARARRDVFTFCMCAGGTVIPSVSEPSMFCSNGMSNSRHDTPFANSGIVATLSPDEFGSPHPLAGMEVQRRFESAAFQLAGGDYSCPIQRANDFVAGRRTDPKSRLASSYRRGVRSCRLDAVIPPVDCRGDSRGIAHHGPEMAGTLPGAGGPGRPRNAGKFARSIGT